jgi:hypothetical protein
MGITQYTEWGRGRAVRLPRSDLALTAGSGRVNKYSRHLTVGCCVLCVPVRAVLNLNPGRKESPRISIAPYSNRKYNYRFTLRKMISSPQQTPERSVKQAGLSVINVGTLTS